MVGLGFLPGGSSSEARAVSADGSVVVGTGSNSSTNTPIIWDASHGLRDLQQVLTNDYGLNLMGWTLTDAEGVSADGDTFIGTGTDPNGIQEAWIATIAVCGDGVVDGNETCDDGNTRNGDGCSSFCRVEAG